MFAQTVVQKRIALIFKIPLIGISYEQKPEYFFSSAHKFNQIGKEEEIDLFYTSKFKESIENEFGKLTPLPLSSQQVIFILK